MRNALGYIRVSSKEQGKSGFGLDLQTVQVREFAAAAGYTLLDVHSEVGTAIGGDSVANRPVLQSVLREAKAKRIPVLVSSMDRLSRDEAEIGRLVGLVRDSGTELIFTDDAEAPDFVHVRVKAAQVQRQTELLSKRTKEGLTRAKAQGKVLGNRTNLPEAQRKGADSNHEKARKWVSEVAFPAIRDLRASGLKTAPEIAKALNERGVRTASNSAWSAANTRRVLRQIEEFDRVQTPDFHKDDPLWGSC
ncbi:MAG: recombinase family protein [Beijerinckiaceae bacterium]|nr:recombinase family protein [Beijerinckiaceae bacterium]